MDNVAKIISLAIGLSLIFAAQAFAGPPFLTDDPEPVDYQHWEFYVFGNGDHTSVDDYTINGPAVELNYGVLPDTQLHLVLPMTTVGVDGAPTQTGLGDMELGVKYRFVHESDLLATNRDFPDGRTADRRLQSWFRATAKPGFACRCGCKRAGDRGRLTAAAARP